MRKSKLKQTLSMLLAVLMVFMSMNFSVFAEELNTQQTEQEIMTNDLAVPAVEDPPAETSTGIEEQQAPALLSNDLPAPAANGAAEDEASLRAAIDAAKEGDVIDVGSYIELTSPLMINKAVTLRGSDMFGTIITKSADSWTANGDKSSGSLIVVADVEGAVNIENMTVTGATDIALTNDGTAYGHGIDVYRSKDVTLKNVFSTANSGAGLIVNGSTVTTQYLMTADNGWYSVNVDNSGAVLNLSSDSVLGDAIQIKSDHGGVTVNASGYTAYTAPDNSIIWCNGDPSGFLNGKAYIQGNDGSYKVFDTIQAAVNAAQNNQTVNLSAGEYTLTDAVTISKPITIIGGEGVTVVPAKDKNAFTINQNITGNITFDGVNINAKNGYTAAQSAHGIQVLNSVKITGSLTIQNAILENLFYGVLTSVDGVENKANTIDNIKIDHVIFKDNLHKAFYTDNAKNVEITNSQFNNCATVTNSGSSWFTRVACDINLKFNTYNSVKISDCTFDGVRFVKDHKDGGTTDNTSYSAALSVKARNDGSYESNAASLNNVSITNNTFTNNDTDLRLGEAGSKGVLADPLHTNSLNSVNINNNHFSALVQNNNDAQYDAANNYWGSDAPAFETLVSGKLNVYPYFNMSDEPVNAPIEVISNGETTQYASLAEAVAAAPEGATVTIKEDITVDAAAGGAIQVTKSMTITADANKKITTKC